MSNLNPYSAIKPDSRHFASYLDFLRSGWIDEGMRPQRINTLLTLLRELERLRHCYSKNVEAAFSSKKIANLALAKKMGYSDVRYLQKLRKWLEEQGILSVKRKKVNGFINMWNSYTFVGFRDWFVQSFPQALCQTGHPKEDNDLRSLFGAKPEVGIRFPEQKLTRWDTATRFWRSLAFEVTNSPPCLSTLSEKFKVNLRKHQIPDNDPNIIARWKSYVKRAVEFQKQAQGTL